MIYSNKQQILNNTIVLPSYLLPVLPDPEEPDVDLFPELLLRLLEDETELLPVEILEDLPPELLTAELLEDERELLILLPLVEERLIIDLVEFEDERFIADLPERLTSEVLPDLLYIVRPALLLVTELLLLLALL